MFSGGNWSVSGDDCEDSTGGSGDGGGDGGGVGGVGDGSGCCGGSGVKVVTARVTMMVLMNEMI